MVNPPNAYQVIIIGGGLAGLTAALHLSQRGIKVLLLEKSKYPRHRVCGEYISNEVLPYLNSLGIDPFAKGAVPISKFEISTKKGKLAKAQLPLGGFGISRYALDAMLYEKVQGVIDTVFDQVVDIEFLDNQCVVKTQKGQYFSGQFVIGAFGKRSNLDKAMRREFATQQSPWLAVKAHYDVEFPNDTVALHNFEGGYCGLSKTEMGTVNACYLTTLTSFKKTRGIDDFQTSVMAQNPFLKAFFKEAEPTFDRPLSIAQISFDAKAPVHQHVFMVGDSAGLIHPLCGNGMAMAIHSAKLISELLVKALQSTTWNRNELESKYAHLWRKAFNSRLYYGRVLQRLLLNETFSHWGVEVVQRFPDIIPTLIGKTHGKPF